MMQIKLFTHNILNNLYKRLKHNKRIWYQKQMQNVEVEECGVKKDIKKKDDIIVIIMPC